MNDRHLISEESIEAIKKQGCCMGKYRVLMSDGYYCYLEGVFDCPHQDRRYIQIMNTYMMACKTNNQLPCQECLQYKEITEVNGTKSHEFSPQ